VTPPRERPRRQRGAPYTGGEPAAHRGRASGNKPQLLVRHGQNDRAIAVGRRNWTFAGSDAGGHRAAAIYTLIETAKLNEVDPQAWLADVLARLQDHPARRIAELLPWNWKFQQKLPAAA
jgi:hypothetical protein